VSATPFLRNPALRAAALELGLSEIGTGLKNCRWIFAIESREMVNRGGGASVQRLLRQMNALPWGAVLLFEFAALVALLLAIALMLTVQSKGVSAAKVGDGSKRIALSFDDAPRGPGAFLDVDIRPQLLTAALQRSGMKQAVFFTNPGRIDASNDAAAQLRGYALAGHVLANHTATHPVLSDVNADRFLADIDAAQAWLKPEKGYRPWFRFPQLDEGGKNSVKRDAVRAGLEARGLRNGYVTADGWDWYLESLTIRAKKSGKRIDQKALRDLYVETHVLAAKFADGLARRALGRAPAHMLLLHETDLAALFIEDLVKALRADGWTIITADEAYRDPIGKEQPVIADANGTLIQMISWDKGVKGPRWFERNEVAMMNQLFKERVLHER
jgi:peptidoglycan-N-acetylglucosamine deacetylase